jgi:hypothetical protein
MTLFLNEEYKYTEPYYTNWYYLRNMTKLQVKALEEMEWDKYYIRILTDLWGVPWVSFSKKDVEDSMELFIDNLNEKIKRL